MKRRTACLVLCVCLLLSLALPVGASDGAEFSDRGEIRNVGAVPEIILYLETPPSRNKLTTLIAEMGISVRDLLRKNLEPYEQLGLADDKFTADQLIDFMLQHPFLITRPIVVTPLGTRLCRPSEVVLDILPDTPKGAFTKEDGEAVGDARGQKI